MYICIISSVECNSPLGMEDDRINNSQITTTGTPPRQSAYGWQARLNKNIPKWGAWCVNTSGGMIKRKNYDQYIMIDLLNLTKITGIATQGRQGPKKNGNEWVRDYKLSYRRDDGVWHFYRGKDNSVKVSLIEMFHELKTAVKLMPAHMTVNSI